MRSAELFSGCGGLALGISRAGFEHILMIEYDGDAVATVEHNKAKRVTHVEGWPLRRCDVRAVDWTPYSGRLALLSGGPPCQPFGIGGKKRGYSDTRDMWPEAIRAVREARPDGFLFENVRNLAGPRFRDYLSWIVQHLRHPTDVRHGNESHSAHMVRLRLSTRAVEYKVIWQVVNAADFGAPQIRHRVLIMGLTASLGVVPASLVATHSRDRLLWDQYVTGEYWKRHGLAEIGEPEDRGDCVRVAELRKLDRPPSSLPWLSVRDAITDLGEPTGRNNHVFQPGARGYKGHTGSKLDMPSKALKAGDHGVPGGENMIRLADGSVRYFTLREAARLVGLPDDYEFTRSWSESMRQLGNAVPAQVGEAAARHLRMQIAAACEKRAILVAA